MSGFLHQGTPTGNFSPIHDVNVYTSIPANPTAQKALLIFPDIYGINLKNTQLLADRFAKDLNVATYLIDTFSGDHAPDLNDKSASKGFNLAEWLKGHGPEKVLPIIEGVIKHLTEKGFKRFAAVGYCFGGKYIFISSEKNWIHVAATCHPSLVEIPGDFKKLLDTSKVPLLINSCEIDQQFPPESQKIADEMLGGGKYKSGYKRNYYPGATHGFGCRANLDNPAEKKAFDESFVETVNWFKTYL